MSNQVDTCCVSVLQARRAAEDCFVEGRQSNWIESMSPCPANQYGLLSNSAQRLILSRISIGMSKCMGCSRILFIFIFFLGGGLVVTSLFTSFASCKYWDAAKTRINNYISF